MPAAVIAATGSACVNHPVPIESRFIWDHIRLRCSLTAEPEPAQTERDSVDRPLSIIYLAFGQALSGLWIKGFKYLKLFQ